MKKTAIITGASSGIGAACARCFAAAGYRVVIAGRNRARCEAVASDCEGALTWTGDLTDAEAAESLAQFARLETGRIDVLINSAGIIFRDTVATTSNEVWRQTIATNLDAPFYLSRACLPDLVAARGVILNVASDWGLNGADRAAAYAASKGGLVLLSRSMSRDHAASGLRVNAICPGDVDTPMLEYEAAQRGVGYDAAMAENHAGVPTGRVTRPDEVASLCLYLASDAAAQITGAALSIDGGATA